MENTYALIPLNSSQVIFNTEFRVARVALLLESDGKIRLINITTWEDATAKWKIS